jgi:hypothetical protein
MPVIASSGLRLVAGFAASPNDQQALLLFRHLCFRLFITDLIAPDQTEPFLGLKHRSNIGQRDGYLLRGFSFDCPDFFFTIFNGPFVDFIASDTA